MVSALILAGVVAVGSLLAWPQLAKAPLWRATITPLASIIGSGFLVLGPILDVSYGGLAPLVMLGLCGTALLFGRALRYNIADIDRHDRPDALIQRLESISSAILAFAFVISVAYYLNLFGAFGVSLTDLDDRYHARLLTTAVFVLILVIGWTRGFLALERLEQLSVGVKLAIIAGLIVGLLVHFGDAARAGKLALDPPTVSGWGALTLAAGLLVTVQGFETSRYLGDAYTAALRIRSMLLAQWIALAIYVTYIALLAFAFQPSAFELSETGIIDLMQIVSPILPTLLVVAALGAQLSAAIADTAGSGGLVHELSRGRISERWAYALLVGVGLALTWSTHVFEIISYASRAFAAYYSIQAAIAALRARRRGQRSAMLSYGAIALLGAAIALVGQPVE